MFLKKMVDFSPSTPGKNRKIKLVKMIFFTSLVIMGIVFSSLTETESATIFKTNTSVLFNINSK